MQELHTEIKPRTNGRGAPRALWLGEWLSRNDLAEPDFLLGHLVSTTSRLLIVGPTGLGKTVLGLAIAIAVASGRGFLKWGPRRPGRVLYIDGEMSRRELRRRLRDAVKREGIIPADGLAILSKEDHEDMPPLNTPQGAKWIDAFLAEHGAFDLIIFDNIQALLAGSMKEEEQWSEMLPFVRSLTKRCIGQIWFHHTGHDESRSYGSKAREWQMDLVALMERLRDAPADIAFSLIFTKARERTPENRADFEPLTLMLTGDRWTQGDAKRADKKLTGHARVALDLLTRAVAQAGERPPACNHIPPDISAVRLSLWREYFYEGTAAEPDKDPDKVKAARQRAFKRASDTLQAAGKIGIWGDWVWLV